MSKTEERLGIRESIEGKRKGRISLVFCATRCKSIEGKDKEGNIRCSEQRKDQE